MSARDAAPPLRSAVLVAKIASALVLGLCVFGLGLFVLMAESGGKEPRPDVLLPLVAAALIVAFGVDARGRRPWLTAALCCGAAGLGALPGFHPLVDRASWEVTFALCWSASLLLALGAAAASRWGRPPTP